METVLEFSVYWIIALTFVAFLAGYIDAIAGGGGMINLPALLFAGVPPVSALAVSKISAIAGTILAVIKFTMSKKIHWRTVAIAAVPCIVASYLGGKVALNLSATVLSWAILICIPIALYIVLRDKTDTNETEVVDVPKTLMAITPIGFYDGILGPGTGTYMTIAVKKVLKFDLLKASATIKPLNLLSNVGAAIAFMLAGKVIWSIAIPMLVGSSAGGWLGSHSAIQGGDKFIRRLLISVLVLMLCANIFKMYFGAA